LPDKVLLEGSEGCLRRTVKHFEQCFGGSRRKSLALLPVAHRVDRHTNAGREHHLGHAGALAYTPGISRRIFARLGIILGNLLLDFHLGGSIKPLVINLTDRLFATT